MRTEEVHKHVYDSEVLFVKAEMRGVPYWVLGCVCGEQMILQDSPYVRYPWSFITEMKEARNAR